MTGNCVDKCFAVWNARPKKKNCLFPSERPAEIFFPRMQPVSFFRNNKGIKKILNRERKLKKKTERKMRSVKKKNVWSLFFVNLLYLHF